MFLRLSLLIVVLAILSKESFGAAPTKAPISIPTVAPSRGPTRTPTATPTAKPSVKPSLRPSAAPTFPAPTAKPTANPTPTPTTATPSVTPTKWPTVVPTAIPTAFPSADPTADPTAAPTADPTVLPSAAPTAEPTLIPTAIPSAEPTIPHPSASPTIRPSANPTLTFAPTVAPTRQMTPIVSWVTNVTLDAVAQPQLDLDCQKTVMATIATFLNLPTTALTYLGSGPATVVPTRRLQQAGEPATYYHFTVSMRVQINLAQTSYTTAFALYNASAPALEHAVHFGDFDKLIQSNAVSMGTPDLERASSYQVFDSPYAVASPDFSKDENLDLTEGGVAIIVICCLVMFFVILYMAWNSTQKHAPPPGVEHATPKGYAVAEDDDEHTTINKL